MKNSKLRYEEICVEILSLYSSDIITDSGAFDGEDDNIEDWNSN